MHKTPPPPDEYAEQFIKHGGWRRVERLYGCRTDMHRKWQTLLGGIEELQRRRKEYLDSEKIR